MIIKRRVTRQFVQLENALVRDRRLDLDEHGMLHYLLSLPDDWEVNQKQCAKFWGIGRDKCRRIFRSLRRTGWAQLERLHAEDGSFLGARWIIGDEPGPETTDEQLAAEAADDDDSVPETPTEETTAAPESQTPDVLVAGDHATPKPAAGLPGARVNHATEKASHGRIKTLEENNKTTNIHPSPAPAKAEAPLGGDDDDDGEPPPTFGELLRIWPADHVISAYACERIFVKLSPKQRRAAKIGMKPYLDDCRGRGHNRLCDLKTFLDERRYEKFASKGTSDAITFFDCIAKTPQAARWREYYERNDRERLRVFDMMMKVKGRYATRGEWPPGRDPGAPATAKAADEPTNRDLDEFSKSA